MANIGYAFAETLDVLQNMDEKYVNQIPIRVLEMIKKNANKSYIKHIDRHNKSKRTKTKCRHYKYFSSNKL